MPLPHPRCGLWASGGRLLKKSARGESEGGKTMGLGWAVRNGSYLQQERGSGETGKGF